MSKKKAVVLLSGGIDSTTALYLAKSKGYDCYALTFDYGQRHSKEQALADAIATSAGIVAHQVISVNLDAWGGSALTDNRMDVPDYNKEETQIPITYVPARNMIFLSIAASYAEVIGARDIFIGISQVDYSGYVDCRKEFIETMEAAINKGTVCGAENNDPIRIQAPFLNMTKADEVKLGISLGVDYSKTWSCYKGEELACGVCDSCRLRLNAFQEAGMADPIAYKKIIEQ